MYERDEREMKKKCVERKIEDEDRGGYVTETIYGKGGENWKPGGKNRRGSEN